MLLIFSIEKISLHKLLETIMILDAEPVQRKLVVLRIKYVDRIRLSFECTKVVGARDKEKKIMK